MGHYPKVKYPKYKTRTELTLLNLHAEEIITTIVFEYMLLKACYGDMSQGDSA